MKTHYEVLGVSPCADIETIKQAFRKAVKAHHPDLR
ncbi:J domain-containing protein, partial [Bradyrhizobium sp. SZCCHNR3008]